MPLEAFDYPQNHKSHPDHDLRLISLMLSKYMAGHPHRPTPNALIEWVKNPETLEPYQQAALREFVDSWMFFDLWTFHFKSGCTLYEIAKAMRVAGAMAPMPVHYINSVARGYCGSDREPDERELLIHFTKLGIDPKSRWRGFASSPSKPIDP